jgi:tRNA-specific 2-thiouridylase
VIGVTMQIWQDEDRAIQEENGGCCGLTAVDDARRVASDLGIPYYVMNFKKEFKENVIDYFVDEYLNGRTPNPCIACNRYVKWESLLKRSMDIGADYIATGHYARIEKLPNGRYSLRRSATLAKDQTYALYNLTQEQLKRTLMPVGAYAKEEVREIAEKIGLRVANKPDSQDICFVPDGNYAEFIELRKRFRKEILCCRMELLSEDIKELPITQLDRGRDLVCRLDILFLSWRSARRRMKL